MRGEGRGIPRFPGTRYQGSKAKLAERIWGRLQGLEFQTCLDAFGGTGAVAYRLKQEGKTVTYNDLLKFNYWFGRALIENRETRLSAKDLNFILAPPRDLEYSDFIQTTFRDIYFTDEENAWLDRTQANLRHLRDPLKFALAFFALSQASLIKRPYNLFHRKNLYVRLAEVPRSFGNKTSWDRPFPEWFRHFAEQANAAVFDNGRTNRALNLDALAVPGRFDLVYIDPPYISRRKAAVNYLDFYHFLEGLADDDEWKKNIDFKSRHLRFKRRANDWSDPRRIHAAFDRLFARFERSILAVSYRSDGIPSISELLCLLKKYKPRARAEPFGKYQYALSKNAGSREVLLIGE